MRFSGLIDFAPPDIITDSYGLCETITGAAEIALENREAQLATAEGTTFFIAEGDDGADQCAPVEPTNYAILGINGGDNTASAYAVDVGGTDFMAQYNADVNGIPLSNYWSAKNNPITKASALSYIPEIPWNDGCTSQLIYSDPGQRQLHAFLRRKRLLQLDPGQEDFCSMGRGGGPSTCFTGKPSIPGVVSGTCKGNPKPVYQYGVPGVPDDGLRDQPDISLFASNGVWGSFYLECMSDQRMRAARRARCRNDAVVQGGGGTSFSAPSMAGIQALINQKFGRQGRRKLRLLRARATAVLSARRARLRCQQDRRRAARAHCIFHDVTRGDMDIPCGRNPDGKFYDCFGAKGSEVIGELSGSNDQNAPAYPATAGYDLATGLGSVDATNLFNAWPHLW